MLDNKRMLKNGIYTVSIIVTAYNVEKYIEQCVCSLIKQTYQNLEIILVNDGSPDNSLIICRKYEKKDNRIKVVDLVVNHGLNYARFEGLKVATGDFVMFVDSDDYIPFNAVEILCNAMDRTGADIVEGSSYRVYDRWGIIKRKSDKKTIELTQPELFRDYFITFFGVSLLGVQLWGKLYKKEIFELAHVEPNHFKMGEDLITNMQIFPYVRKYVVLNENVYYYRYGGMTSKFNPSLWSDLKEHYNLKKEMIEKYGREEFLYTVKVEMCNVLCSNLIQMFRLGKKVEEIYAFVIDEIEIGYIDEITVGIEFKREANVYLKRKDIESLLAYCRKEANKQRFLRFVFHKLFPYMQ